MVDKAKARRIAARRAQVVKLRAAGWTYREIGAKLGLSPAAAMVDYHRALGRDRG